MTLRRLELLIAALVVLVLLGVGIAEADNNAFRDSKKESKALKRNPEVDVVRAQAGHDTGNRLKHKITMRGRISPEKGNTRPFLLINTKGGKRSDYEYLVYGPRVFRKVGDNFRKTGANKVATKKRTWVYRFKLRTIGITPSRVGPEDAYGWSVLTAKNRRATDLAPARQYKKHRLADQAPDG